MEWHVQYKLEAENRVEMHPTPEAAIEAACLLMEAGCDVYGIGTGPLHNSIEPHRIKSIYEQWLRARYPFGYRALLHRDTHSGE